MFDLIRKHWRRDIPVAIDVETTGLNPHRDKIFGIAITIKVNGQYISDYEDVRGQEKRMAGYIEMLCDQCSCMINHGTKYDAQMLRSFGVKFDGRKWICSLVRANLIDENLYQYSLDKLSEKYLAENKINDVYTKLAELFGGKATRKAQILNLQHAPITTVAPYAKKDTELAYKLYEWQEEEIKRQGLQEIDELERETLATLTDMEYHGVRVDLDEAERAKKELASKLAVMEKELKSLIGDVNPNSPKQLKSYFNPKQEEGEWCVDVKGKKYILDKTDTGEPSFSVASLQKLPLREAMLILDVKSTIKTKDTFVGGHILDSQYRGRVYPNINQVKNDDGGTGTGRLSYTKPALQQIPSRNKAIAKVVRSIFLPEEGHRWVYGDLDQHEYRVFAHYSRSAKLIAQYAENPDLDVHQFVADLCGIPRNVPKMGGANAKQLNLSIIFSMSDGRVAETLGLPYTVKQLKSGFTVLVAGKETKDLLDRYHEEIQGVKLLQDKVKAKAKATGSIRTIMGRKIRFPNGRGAYKAGGLLFQASSGDLNKSNMNKINRVLEGSGAKLLLNIHDEYSMSIPYGQENLINKVQATIQDRPELRVPIRIDFNNPAKNWWEATQEEKFNG